MTKAEKNKKIKNVEEQIAKLQKKLEDIRNTEIQEWDFSTWHKIPLRKRYEFDIPADPYAIIPFNNRLDELSKLMEFKFCYDCSYVPNFDDTTEKYYIMFSNHSGKYEISYNFNIKIPGVVYFSSEKIAKKCADWMNEGCPGYLEEE